MIECAKYGAILIDTSVTLLHNDHKVVSSLVCVISSKRLIMGPLIYIGNVYLMYIFNTLQAAFNASGTSTEKIYAASFYVFIKNPMLNIEIVNKTNWKNSIVSSTLSPYLNWL